MITTLLAALMVLCAVSGAKSCNSTDWSVEEVSAASKEELDELKILQQMEIERQKRIILQKLGHTRPPIFANFSHQLPKHLIRMWTEHESLQPPPEPQENLAQLVIFPKNSKFECRWNESSSCRRFEFAVSPDVLRSPSEFMVHRLRNHSTEAVVSVFFSKQRQQKEKMVETKDFAVGKKRDRWVSFQLRTFEMVKFWMENMTFAVEITGLPIDEAEPNLPFLKMRKDMAQLIRNERSENNTRNSGCHKVPFNISFHDVGFGDWIEYPHVYEANMCKGYCQHVQNHHENFMGIIFQNNKTLEKEYGRCWFTCCRPKTFATLDMIYRASNDTYIHTKMTDMIVTECSCS